MAENFLGLGSDVWLALAAQYLQGTRNPDGMKIVTTDDEKAINQRKLDFIDHGSPTTNWINGIAQQAIKGLSESQPNISFRSKYMEGQAPMGGMKAPQFDFSSLPSLGSGGMHPSTPAAGVPSPAGPTSEPPSTWGVHGDPNGSLGAPAGSPGDPFAGMPAGSPGDTNIKDVFGRGIQYLRDHPSLAPNLLKGGGAALFAALGASPLLGLSAGNSLYNAWANWNDRNTVGTQKPLPTDILRPGPSGPPNFWGPTGPPPTPTTPRENISPGFSDRANSDWINNFMNNLQYGGGNTLGRVGRPGGRKGLR